METLSVYSVLDQATHEATFVPVQVAKQPSGDKDSLGWMTVGDYTFPAIVRRKASGKTVVYTVDDWQQNYKSWLDLSDKVEVRLWIKGQKGIWERRFMNPALPERHARHAITVPRAFMADTAAV